MPSALLLANMSFQQCGWNSHFRESIRSPIRPRIKRENHNDYLVWIGAMAR